MATRRWAELSPRTRRLLILTGTVDAVLRLLALNDLRTRPAALVRGSKARWAFGLVVVNSVGLLPLYYFLRARRTD